ncbi:uncharacterized protein NDAI_0D00100 [Naumovozyma dairenensis CBS 421]|uniref:Protein BIG1 n=1 Tax=Naumovozyma dairenensis (strain ATCC 10597 / BCRC 20456 / CBS 421 / NBRC 0211 / NRRL Y-12639) TaxID=1071378 RepID=G0W963_NAUDC|nr:hypothetical protein NDAI_0D00100 [Naumovozyma dairenensis CBS 421]CCD24324.1 hypothetical protein NDAI_0D00100 [Naumovozyma dairenensis CBS 421]
MVAISQLLVFFLVVRTVLAVTIRNGIIDSPLPRDNTTLVDALNLMRCAQVWGMPNDTIVATDRTETLILFNNRTTTNTTHMKEIANHCFSRFGYTLAFTHYNYKYFPGELTHICTLDDALRNWDLLPTFARNELIAETQRGPTSTSTFISHKDTSEYYFMVMAVLFLVIIYSLLMRATAKSVPSMATK